MQASKKPREDSAVDLRIWKQIVADRALIEKISGKKFKNDAHFAFPLSIIPHPILGEHVYAYMLEDDSYIECRQCREAKLEGQEPRVMRALEWPRHPYIGRFFRSTPFGYDEQQVYFCDSWVRNAGFWMTNVIDPSDRRNVSERAIDRTYHRISESGGKHSLLQTARSRFGERLVSMLHDLDPLETR